MNQIEYYTKSDRKDLKRVYDAVLRLEKRFHRHVYFLEIEREVRGKFIYGTGFYLTALYANGFVDSDEAGWFIVRKTRKPFRKYYQGNCFEYFLNRRYQAVVEKRF